ncbi:FKBP12-associated protein [Aspergillus hancockii]|nr:FKBP12-associated protein [Aspergillus hancockii]
MITATCGCGRLRQERRCNAAKAITSKGQLQQPQRSPALTPLTCDEECARLERNRSLASALGVDINQSTTVAQNLTPTNLPYSAETLDMYIQITSSAPLSTLQSYESTLHSLAANNTQRSVRFQPAKSSLRAFLHSLAADWGFASESFDPEPHRHVFVLKPTVWKPPPLGMGNGTAIGIGGMSVSECVKLRERQRQREREAQRLAAAEAKAQREAVKTQASTSGDGGWAQVAASRRSNASTRSTTPNPGMTSLSSSMFAALAGDDGGLYGAPRKGKLVLRSGVGAGKQLKSAPAPAEVADSWEEEEEKQEEEERAREQEKEQEQKHVEGDNQKETYEAAPAETGEVAPTSPVV